MSLSAILSSSTSALRTVQTQLQWRSDNISNASNPNYVRRDPRVTNSNAHFTDVTVQRAIAPAMQIQLLNTSSTAAASDAQLKFFKQIGDVLGTSESSPYLATAMEDFVASWKAYESDPASTTSENEVIRTSQLLADRMRSMYSETRRIETELRSDMGLTVSDLNTKLTELDTVNKRISGEPQASTLDPQLFDDRDQLVKDISGYVGLTVINHTDGSVALYTKGGTALVDHNAAQFQWNNPVGAPPFLSVQNVATTYPGSNAAFIGGKIGGTLDILNPSTASTTAEVGSLAKVRAQLNDLANQLTGCGLAGQALATGSTTDHLFYDSMGNAQTMTVTYTNVAGTTWDLSATPPTIAGVGAATVTMSPTNITTNASNMVSTPSNGQVTFTVTWPAAVTATGVTSPQTFVVDYNSFGAAYGSASPDRSTDVVGSPDPAAGTALSSFFTRDNSGPPPSEAPAESIAINANFLTGSSVMRMSATPVVTALTSATRTLGSGGINVANRTYDGLAGAVSQYHINNQSALNTIAIRQDSTLNTLETQYSASVGVNMDSETAQLSVLQTAYSANARVISTVQSMYETLLSMGR